VFLAIASAAVAGPFEDGQAAYDRHDYATALQVWRPLADHGDASAQNKLGVMYALGHGVAQDFAEAVKWYCLAADQGNAEAVKWVSKAADQGNATAQFNLGVMYAQGHGVPQSDAEAVKWYRKAADQGDAHAQASLGVIYDQGHSGVPQNYAEALKWFRKAADQGNAEGQYNLGLMYASGHGIPQDLGMPPDSMHIREAVSIYSPFRVPPPNFQAHIFAHEWFDLASAQGYTGATKARDVVAKDMSADQIDEAQRLALEWKPTEPGGSPALSREENVNRPTDKGLVVLK
jgi:TPR repeat protein